MMFDKGLNGGCNYGHYNNFGNGGYGFMHYGFGLLIAIGIIIFIAVLIYFLTRRNKKLDYNSSPVLETLKMKYVQGEITEEEYLRRKDLLTKL